MIKYGIDEEAVARGFAEATARQGDALRKMVGDATMKAMQARQLTVRNLRQVLVTVTKAASTGAARNPLGTEAVEPLLAKAFAGMDAALELAVEAHRRALQRIVEQGVELQEKKVAKALGDVEQMEDLLFTSVRKAMATTAGPLQTPWMHVIDAMRVKGTATGGQAEAVVTQTRDRAQQSLKQGRALGLRGARSLLDGYAALVSGVLIGMADGLKPERTAAPARARSRKSAAP